MLHLLPALGRSDVLRAHHRDHLTRVYPLGTRFDSSNMGANTVMGCFHAGVQMTCLNYQTFDAGQQLNRALFQLNGGCGYVLQECRAPEAVPPAPQFLELSVVAAQHLPKARSASSPTRGRLRPGACSRRSGSRPLVGGAGAVRRRRCCVPPADAAQGGARLACA